jgi:regulator of sigma E protease
LSAALGLFNLLPIPAMDGARLVFLLIEGIRKKPVPPEREGMVHLVGFALLIGLAIFIAFRDIVRLIS